MAASKNSLQSTLLGLFHTLTLLILTLQDFTSSSERDSECRMPPSWPCLVGSRKAVPFSSGQKGTQGCPRSRLPLNSCSWVLSAILVEDGPSTTLRSKLQSHINIKWASDDLFQRFVLTPTANEDPCDSFHEFEIAGMGGCIGNTDVCHLRMLNCHHWIKIHNSGFKMSMPTRTFNLTANHRRRIISTTTGHPGRFNDKTLVRFDKFVMNVKQGKILPSNTFVARSSPRWNDFCRKWSFGPSVVRLF